METDPDRWIAAVRHSHDTLRALAGPLTAEQLEQRSYDTEWSIAQVLSHLGSQAEVFNLWLDAGLTGQDPPGAGRIPPDLGGVEHPEPSSAGGRLAAGQRDAGQAAGVARQQ